MIPKTLSHARVIFRFLDLPTEIRLIVYEQLDIVIRHSTTCMAYTTQHNGSSTLVLKLLPLAIFRVCKTTYSEAYAMLRPKMYEILAHPPRIMITGTDLLSMQGGFAGFLGALKKLRNVPGPVTKRSEDARMLPQVTVAWASAFRSARMPAVVNPSLIQWILQANAYLKNTTAYPLPARSLPTTPSDIGIQLLIRQTEKVLPCIYCPAHDLPHLLIIFLCRNFGQYDGNPRVDVSLLDPALDEPSSGYQGRGPLVHTVESLRRDLAAAFFNLRGSPLHAHGGGVVELAVWEQHWLETPAADLLDRQQDEGKETELEEETNRSNDDPERPSSDVEKLDQEGNPAAAAAALAYVNLADLGTA
jgi:hypothetical protein